MGARAGVVPAAILLLLGCGLPLRAQTADVAEVRRIIKEETDSYYRRDAEGWKRTWVLDSTAIRTFITSTSYSVARGWNNFGAATVEDIRKNPTPQPVQIERTNYVIRVDGALAWAEYDEKTVSARDSVPLLARQIRILVKRNGEWRILSAGSFVGSSYGTPAKADSAGAAAKPPGAL